MMIAGLSAACGGQHPANTVTPSDPFMAVPAGMLPVVSLSGASVLLLAAGGLVVGDTTNPVPELEGRRGALLVLANATLDTAVRRDGREVTWMGLEEQRRAARRNPTLGLDPDRFATAVLFGAQVDHVPDPLWAHIRSLGAITGTRYAVVPAAVKISGSAGAYLASYVIVVVDVRTGGVIFRARSTGRPAATAELALSGAASAVIASPLP